jgi:hypothetical protein
MDTTQMFISINRTRMLELVGQEVENDENLEYYLLVKVEPVSREDKYDDTIQKVAVHNGIAYTVHPDLAAEVIKHSMREHE